jgi:hypothetical protein
MLQRSVVVRRDQSDHILLIQYVRKRFIYALRPLKCEVGRL